MFLQNVLPFNPIKVLFYQGPERNNLKPWIDFQSYQGSILSESRSLLFLLRPFSFQSYQGSILSTDTPYQSANHCNFQSYQGSILSGLYLSVWNDGKVFQSYQGSILSIFFPQSFFLPQYFQSYQGSILSFSDMKIYKKALSFNPIKVLFYHGFWKG